MSLVAEMLYSYRSYLIIIGINVKKTYQFENSL